MDIEASERKRLIDRFSKWFDFEEEVNVFSTHYNKSFRVDVLARPKNKFPELVFAFEVKNKPDWKMANFSKACKQATDYVYCVVEQGKFHSRVINSAYVFLPEDGARFRPEEEKIVLGIKHLAAKSRVGTLTTKHENKKYWKAKLRLSQDIWYSDTGYNLHAEGNLVGNRPLGGSTTSWTKIEKNITQIYKLMKS